MPTVSPGARFIDPQILARIGNLELVARWVVEGFISGLHKAPYLGVSIDFAEHRGYMPGDDIRRVDWRLYARTDRFYVKQFEADTNTNFSVLFDVSKSMSFGSRGVTKLDYGRFLAACLCYLSTKQRDRVGIVTFDDDIIECVPPSDLVVDVDSNDGGGRWIRLSINASSSPCFQSSSDLLVSANPPPSSFLKQHLGRHHK